MRRGAAAMGGRSGETTNCYDPSQNSTAQRTHESTKKDIFKFYEPPPPDLKYTRRDERRRIHAFNYKGSPHADLHGINADAEDLMDEDPSQAERFFGNRIVYGQGSWMDGSLWEARSWQKLHPGAPAREVPAGTAIVLGFDGSDTDDWTVLRAQTADGHQFTPVYGEDRKPCVWNPAEHRGQVPRLEVAAAIEEMFDRFMVARLYADPPDWKTEIDAWAAEHGEKVVLRWETYRITQMHAALVRQHSDVTKASTTFTHDGCPVTFTHVKNARKLARAGQKYILGKPSQAQKIDAAMSSTLADECAGDVTAAGAWPKPRVRRKVIVMS
jgi:hypothetical protein